MKFDEDFDTIYDEIGGAGNNPFKNNDEENIYQLLKPYLENTYNQEIDLQHEEYDDSLGYEEMRVIIIDIDKLILFIKGKQRDDLIPLLVNYQNKTINKLFFKILIKWLFDGAPIDPTYYCAFYYFNNSAYGNIIKLYFKNG